ncbi:MAG: alanyl-tRNA editing protein [Granulosicoccus sp.]|nr:alanyl-tRNA editing protein [Granulosicoccus sp.]
MTRELFREDSYLKTCVANITAITETGVQTDQSVFYPLGGGQLGDTGWLVTADGARIDITDTVMDRDTRQHLHVIQQRTTLSVGDSVSLELDWDRRYRLMRFHSCLHMLCSLIDAPVTSGSIQVDRARLDFDLKDPIDKEPITKALNDLVERDVAMSMRWITDAELDAQPELVRTMSVQPPRNAQGTIRLVEFKGVDLQPCGGTHVASTGEIGAVRVQKIEKKGKQNRRIIVVFEE